MNNLAEHVKIGHGAYSSVYRVKLPRSGECFAIKYNLVETHTNSLSHYYELQINMMAMKHPNIVKICDIIHGLPTLPVEIENRKPSDDHYGLKLGPLQFMYELASCDLHEYFHMNRSCIDYEGIIEIILQICLGLSHLHKLGYMHRDVKTENILVFEHEGGKNVYKIADFGFAKRIVKHQRSTPYVGTPMYRAPECVQGAAIYDDRVDSWAVGCILYELLSGLPPSGEIHSDDNAMLLSRLRANLENLESKLKITVKITEDQLEAVRDFLHMMLDFDQHRRSSISDALDHVLFERHRAIIARDRKTHRMGADPLPPFEISRIDERISAMRYIYDEIYLKSRTIPWFNYELIFQAIDHYDKYLVSMKHPTENKVAICKLITILNLIMKCRKRSKMGSSLILAKLPMVFDDLAFETEFVRDVLKYEVVTETVYDYALSLSPFTDDEASSLLMVTLNAHHVGMNVKSAYEYWREHESYYNTVRDKSQSNK